ncbi:SpoIIE family protein phosphatase [Leptospira bandrabouensis]|uniref:GAF domain-containing protein n=1 Tax=Leptospira bandrabouensis TaxID=2484903 RepID=A0A6H3NL00_9LEPT|nr:SpoIIE family protein phosphatase [Leptospira bandrabouensis]MCG6146366.1 SpoIIE family protein phosphatase [Leptospira bandrabouensis]MCG6153770.1 SpoIIE family protein phosphatase [Leptospira bandrabouensis]MCG6161219.1 SpoIIE family protein phosphatase [Leptospira bandrabouensis]MCG6165953.1 SpoIIE family protein phosphatase [Leptospira bandrabouensis]MCW7458052.1 SpoIIE family protein phosphatase [Leptospira bandrabouensis]
MPTKLLTLGLISDITSRINSHEDLDTLLSEIMGITRDVLQTEGSSLLLYDKENDQLVFNTTSGLKEESLAHLTVPRGKGIAGMVLETLKPEIVNDAANDPRIFKAIDQKVGYVTRNLLCVPMVAQGEVQGVLEAVNSLDNRDFNHTDIKILKYLSNLAAIAVKNRLLIDSLNLRANELNGLFQISQALANIQSSDEFMDLAVKTISEVLQVDRVSLHFEKIEKKGLPRTKSKGFSDQIHDEDVETLLFADKADWMFKGYKIITANSPQGMQLTHKGLFQHSMIIFPILKNKEWLGSLLVSDKTSRTRFDEMDIRILRTLTNQVGEAYTALQVKIQSERLKNIDRDMQVAAMIQKHSLPIIPKQYSLLEFDTYYQASREIGGDFYDMVVHGKDEVSVIIADVSGKGTPAALFMEFSKTVLQQEVAKTTSTSEALFNANQILQDKSGFLMFVTAMLVRINMTKKELTYSSAGHNLQIIYRKKHHKIQHLSGKGQPMGIGKCDFSEHTVSYLPGDLLVLYTDGVTEAMNMKEELFSEERLESVILSHINDPPEVIRQAILQKVSEFVGEAEPHDDLSLFIIRLN